MHVEVGERLLSIARETGSRSLFIVGTGKNVGKTVTMRAIYEASVRAGVRAGVTSIGRDGEAIDVGDAQSKPRLFLRAGTVVATAREVLPRSPASEILELSQWQTAAGPLVYARVCTDAYYELVGAPTASGLRASVSCLLDHAEYAIVDGAIDRIAALAGGDDAVVVSTGASAAPTVDEAVAGVAALVERLRIPRVDPEEPCVRLEGALTTSAAAAMIAARESRTIVLADPTRFVLTGKAALSALSKLRIRVERPVHVVALTIASIGRDRVFEPRLFAHAVREATGLPVFDVFASEEAA